MSGDDEKPDDVWEKPFINWIRPELRKQVIELYGEARFPDWDLVDESLKPRVVTVLAVSGIGAQHGYRSIIEYLTALVNAEAAHSPEGEQIEDVEPMLMLACAMIAGVIASSLKQIGSNQPGGPKMLELMKLLADPNTYAQRAPVGGMLN